MTNHPNRSFDFSFTNEQGRTWFPISIDGQDAVGEIPELEPWGKVTVHKICYGSSSQSWKSYSSLASARSSAKQLALKLRQTGGDPVKWNACVDNWLERA